jgi:hypothetical protein
MGRIVVYNNPGSLDGKYPPTKSPALIVKVNQDGTILAHVFTDRGSFIQPALQQGDGPSQWNWPIIT